MFKKWFPSWYKVNSKNSLATLYPELAIQFHKNKNLLTADNVSNKVNKNHKEEQEFWWQCTVAEDHQYQSNIRSKIYNLYNNKESCPMCTGKLVVKSNSLAYLSPEIANQWDETRNGISTPEKIWFKDNTKEIYWICENSVNHKPKTTVATRTINPTCKYCSISIIKMRPIIKENYNPQLNNGISLYDIFYSPTRYGNDDWKVLVNPNILGFINPNKREFIWECKENHQWEASMRKKLISPNLNGSKAKCPHCKRISNSLLIVYPQIAKYWHPTNNDNLLPIDISQASGTEVWWKCKEKGHVWKEAVGKVTRREKQRKTFCIQCKEESKSLIIKSPEIAKEWHPTKNNNYRFNGIIMTPSNTSAGYSKKVWWKCDKGFDHEWEATVKNRYKDSKCPVCSGNKITRSNSLAFTNPKIAKEWHPTKNGQLSPRMISEKSGKAFWWKCKKKGHVWKERIDKLSKRKNTCPKCKEVIKPLDVKEMKKIKEEYKENPFKSYIKFKKNIEKTYNIKNSNKIKELWNDFIND